MNYWVLQARSKKTFNPLSKIIMSLQGVNFSHVAFAAVGKDNHIVIYHAKWPKPCKCDLAQFTEEYEIIEAFKLKNPDPYLDEIIIKECESFIVPESFYSLAQLVMIYLEIKFSKIKTILKMAILNHEHGLICSEMLARILTKGWDLIFEVSYDSIDLIQVIQKARLAEDKQGKWSF